MPGGTPSAAAPRRPQTTLGSPNFAALWGSSTAANLADGLFQVALALLALTLTSAPGLIAAVTVALTLPWLLVALPVGAWWTASTVAGRCWPPTCCAWGALGC
jgi:hypothetical protein